MKIMKNYIILANPGHNRIYHDAAMDISVQEIEALSLSQDMGLRDIKKVDAGLPAGLAFSAEKELSQDDLKTLAASSIYYALFEKVQDDLLKPVPVPDFRTFPESMVQILKYNGKTNEQFTRLMVNLAVSACGTNTENKILLDPVMGKGTTLFEGLIRGMNVIGVDVHEKWTHEAQIYVERFMKEGKYKHKAVKGTRNDEKGRKIAGLFTLNAAPNKEDYRSGNTRSCRIINADTRIADEFIKNHSCDMIVADLPYGVQHTGKTDRRSRSPLELVEEALPAWSVVLKSKGSMVLAFNEHTLQYHDISLLLKENGFTVLNEHPYFGFSHRVDQSIKRDVIVAVKI